VSVVFFISYTTVPIDMVVGFYRQRAGAENLIQEAHNDAGLAAHPSARWSGIGGVDKTAVAEEHCYRASADYQLVWWVRAARKSFAFADLGALGEPLGTSKQ
jgi:hypothetical protein